MVSRLATNHQRNPASNTKIDILGLMNTLAAQRKAYHSEADFQHAFAWEVHRQFPESSVLLERPLSVNGKTLHLDLFIQLLNKAMAIELKYKTRKLVIELEGEAFSLASHSALDIGRYDFIKDIVRLESIASNLANCEGYAVLLTNDSAYWKPRTQGTVDEAFSLTEGRTLSNSMAWTEKASDGTKKNREKQLQLTGSYKLNWQDFSVASTESYG
jgi:hypothetical protein